MKLILSIIGILLILVGIVLVPLPIPFGLILIFLGTLLLVTVNSAARKIVKSLRRRWKWLDRLLDRAAEKLPHDVAEPVEATKPLDDEEEEADSEDDVHKGHDPRSCPHANQSAKPLRRVNARPRYHPSSRRGG